MNMPATGLPCQLLNQIDLFIDTDRNLVFLLLKVGGDSNPVADRIHIHRLGKRLCVIDPKDYTMSDAVAFMTGAKEPPTEARAA